jgi:hypothetical protein
MWGKPVDASVEETGNWFALPNSYADDCTIGLVGPFASEAAGWDWLEECVRVRRLADGGCVWRLSSPDQWHPEQEEE